MHTMEYYSAQPLKYPTTLMNLKILCSMKEALHKRAYGYMEGGKKGIMAVFGRHRWEFTGKEHEEPFWDDGYVLYPIRVLMHRYVHLLELIKWYT